MTHATNMNPTGAGEAVDEVCIDIVAVFILTGCREGESELRQRKGR